MSGWQDIKTAPKDGTIILLCSKSGDEDIVMLGRWDDGAQELTDSKHGRLTKWRGMAGMQQYGFDPTLWLSIPDRPE